jgi:hypothetical protein
MHIWYIGSSRYKVHRFLKVHTYMDIGSLKAIPSDLGTGHGMGVLLPLPSWGYIHSLSTQARCVCVCVCVCVCLTNMFLCGGVPCKLSGQAAFVIQQTL